jgi:hypothetical protein
LAIAASCSIASINISTVLRDDVDDDDNGDDVVAVPMVFPLEFVFVVCGELILF